MPAEKQLVMVRPNWDTATQFGSYWLGQQKSPLYDRGMLVTDLAGDLANKDELLRVLQEVDPLTVWIMGHGTETQVAGQDNYVLLMKGIDEGLMVGRVVHLTSCLTGVLGGLLQSLAKAGALACFGYSVELIVGVETENFPMSPDNNATKSLMRPDVIIELALAEGKTVSEAFKVSDEVANEEIEYWRSSGHPDADLLMFCHIHNYNGKVLYGEAGSVTRPTLASPVDNLSVAASIASFFALAIAVIEIFGGR